MTCIFTYNVTFPQVFFKHFASKNQPPGLFVIGTLDENGLNIVFQILAVNLPFPYSKLSSELIDHCSRVY